MLSIGEFSLITKLPVKTLRFYHEENLLEPDYIDDESGYRYYRAATAERAQIITLLRSLNFSINEIRTILSGYSEDAELRDIMQQQKNRIDEKIKELRTASRELEQFMKRTENTAMEQLSSAITEKILEEIIFTGVRYTGRYNEIGKSFRLAARTAGRFICGPAMGLYYDGEYKESDADIEGGFPVSRSVRKNGIESRTLPGGTAITLIHRGSYETIGKSYAVLFDYINERKLTPIQPSREIYHKGPGIIFRGNPAHYITEIQILVK